MIDDTVRWCNLVGEYLKKRKERSQKICQGCAGGGLSDYKVIDSRKK